MLIISLVADRKIQREVASSNGDEEHYWESEAEKGREMEAGMRGASGRESMPCLRSASMGTRAPKSSESIGAAWGRMRSATAGGCRCLGVHVQRGDL